MANTGRSSKPKRSPLSHKKVTVRVLAAGMKTPQKKSKSSSRYFQALLLLTGNNNTTKIDVFSYGDWATRNYGLLKEGLAYEVSGKMFEATKTKFNRHSTTKGDKFWIFEEVNVLQSTAATRTTGGAGAGSEAATDVADDVITVAKVSEFVSRKRNSGLCKMEGVHIVKAKIYRYMGCVMCKKSLSIPNRRGLFSCQNCNAKFESTERAMYMMLRDVVLQDGTGKVDNVVCFDGPTEELLNKKAAEFICDEEAKALLENWINSTVDLEIQVTKPSHRRYPPTTCISSITVRSTDNSRTPKKYFDERILRDSKDLTPAGADADTIISELTGNVEALLDLDSFPITVNRTICEPRIKKDLKDYELASTPSGHLLIINNKFAENPDLVRKGTEKDAEYLTKLFEQLDFKVFVNNATSSERLQEILADFKENLVKESISSCAVVVLSHGAVNKMQLEDGSHANIWTDVVEPFNDTNFPDFSGRPKIFAFNTCQIFAGDATVHDAATNLRDTMIIYAATPGQYAYRNTSTGSNFIRCFIQVVAKNAVNWDLNEIVEEMQKKMSGIEPVVTITGPGGKIRQAKIQQTCYSNSFCFQRFQFKVLPTAA